MLLQAAPIGQEHDPPGGRQEHPPRPNALRSYRRRTLQSRVYFFGADFRASALAGADGAMAGAGVTAELEAAACTGLFALLATRAPGLAAAANGAGVAVGFGEAAGSWLGVADGALGSSLKDSVEGDGAAVVLASCSV